MEVFAKVKKVLPVRSGNGKNGEYEYHPYIIEWEDAEPRGTFILSAVVEFSGKTTKVKDIDALCNTDTPLQLSLGNQVEEYQGKYYNRLNAYLRDDKYRVPKEY